MRFVCLFLVYASCTTSALQYPVNLATAAALLDVGLPTPRNSLRAAYRKKAATTHPDISLQPNAHLEFQRITAAYEVLLQFGTCKAPPPTTAAAPSQQPFRSTRTYTYANKRTRVHVRTHTTSSSWRATIANHRDPGRMERRIGAWRDYWQLSLLATKVQGEALNKGAQAAALSLDLQRLTDQLASVIARGESGDAIIDVQEKCAQMRTALVDLECAAHAFKARAMDLQQQAEVLQQRAQCVS
jgi:hypothetical protein